MNAREPHARREEPPPAVRKLVGDLVRVSQLASDGTIDGPEFAEFDVPPGATLVSVLQVRRAGSEAVEECDGGNVAARRGDAVLVETPNGVEVCRAAGRPRREMVEGTFAARALRIASDNDIANARRLEQREADALNSARGAVRALRMPAKVVRVQLASAGRVIVSVAAEERIDLRELIRGLASALHSRIELRLIGMRDAARLVGAIGPCGQQLCCSTFMGEFAPVSVRMAKDQGLALNPQRISGLCGKLMCCLVFEQEFYRTERARYPKLNKRVTTPRGEGRVKDVDVLSQVIRVGLTDGSTVAFAPDDVRPVNVPDATRRATDEGHGHGHDDDEASHANAASDDDGSPS